jgi:drug/metabolite transporter (DMT)-like permease
LQAFGWTDTLIRMSDTASRPPLPADGVPAWTTYAALTAAVLFWGVSFVATKIALDSLSPAAYMLLRFAVAAVPFGVLLMVIPLPRLPGRVHLRLLLVALFEPGLYFVFETEGLARTSAAKASIIIAAIPVVVAVASRLLLRERMPRRAAVGAVASIVGVAVLVLADPAAGVDRMVARIGDLFIMGAVVAATFYMLAVRSIHTEVRTIHITALQVLYGTVFFGLYFLVVRPDVAWRQIPPEAIAALGFLVVFATVAAFFAYNYALSRVTAGQAAVTLNGIPVVTAVTAWVVLGERLTPLQISGGVLVLVGVTVANATRRRRPAA